MKNWNCEDGHKIIKSVFKNWSKQCSVTKNKKLTYSLQLAGTLRGALEYLHLPLVQLWQLVEPCLPSVIEFQVSEIEESVSKVTLI